MKNTYTKRLILIVLYAVFPIHAFASGIRGGALELALFTIFAIPLLLCLGSWIAGKGNRLFYILTAPIVVGLIMAFFNTILGFMEASFFSIFVSPIIYALLIVKMFKPKEKVYDGIVSCCKCGFEAGFVNLKNGLCKSCFEKQLTEHNITKKSS